MRTVSPHRKRQANKGRFDNAIVIRYDWAQMEDGRHWAQQGVTVRDSMAESHDAIDGIADERTMHRNRFNGESRLALIAPDVSDVRTCLAYARKRLGELVEFDEIVVELGRAQMRTVKCTRGGDELLKFISGNRAAKLFTVESAVCSDRTAPPANTLRKLHGRSY